MFEREYSREKVEKLMLFMANMLALPKKLEMMFRTKVTQKHLKSDIFPLTSENSVFADTYRYEGIIIGRKEGMKKKASSILTY